MRNLYPILPAFIFRPMPWALGLILALLAQTVPAQERLALPPDWPTPRLIIKEHQEYPVVVEQVDLAVEIHGSQALTRVEMRFANPNNRVLEGELQFPLLDSQQVVGMALDIDGRLRDAVPVDKAKGRQVFDDVVRRNIDPALLEKTVGNNYSLRLYPIPAKGSRRVVLRILESLPTSQGELRYRLPITWADKLARLALSIKVFGAQAEPVALPGPLGEPVLARKGEVYELDLERRAFEGRGLFTLRLPAPAMAQVVSQRHAGLTYFRAEIPAPAAAAVARYVPGRVALYWDASGSGAMRDHGREVALLERYFRAMGNGEVYLVRFRDVAEAPRRFTVVDGKWPELRQALEETVYDGATAMADLPRLKEVGEALLFSDGLANYAARRLPDPGVPTYPVSAALSADGSALRLLALRTGGRYIDLQRCADSAAASLLLEAQPRLAALDGSDVGDLLAESTVAEDGRYLVAGRVTGERPSLRLTLRLPDGTARDLVVDIPKAAATSLAAPAWARLKLAELDGEYALHRAEIQRLGRLFRIPSRETSLLVLDRVEDYVRYEIEPPEELRAEYDRQRALARATLDKSRTEQLDKVAAQFSERLAWWRKDFPKDMPQLAIAKKDSARATGAMAAEEARASMPAPAPRRAEGGAPAMARAAAMPVASAPQLADAAEAASHEVAPNSIAVAIKPWASDAPYLTRMRAATGAERYRVYLDVRPDWANSSAFYLDAAEVFFAAGERDLALRILSNLAEMNLENRELLRILGYRLLQAARPELAVHILEEVLRLAPDEPQSYRDLGLAQAQAGRPQQAVDLLWETVARPWNSRFPDIEMTALAELNSLVANAAGKLDTGRIDPRLLRNLPLDVRVVLSWDTDNTDIDLWVTDPNGERAYYGNALTYQGGRMSKDFTGGYGPEEFALMSAKPGIYRVQANFFGNRRQTLSGASTLSVKLYTHFGTARQQEKLITLRLDKARESVDIAEFEVRAGR